MDRRPHVPTDPGRDYRTLLLMGWTPDSVPEAVEIAADLLRSGEVDAALAAVESARGIAASAGAEDAEVAALDSLGFQVALQRGDAERAIKAANALRHRPGALPAPDLDWLRAKLASCEGFRPELKEALRGVLDVVSPAPERSIAIGFREEHVAFGGRRGAGGLDDDDEIPYFADELDGVVAEGGGVSGGASDDDAAHPDAEWVTIADEPQAEEPWSFGAFPVGVDESLSSIRSRFMEAAVSAGPEQARDACETGWSFFLMEDFEAAAVLFGQALGDATVRVAAAEGLVRCHLNLSQASEAVGFLERLQGLCFADRLPEPLRYWYGRAAEAAGDARKARGAYRSVSPGAFPDVATRLAALP
jgi:tetratricopeptide (TPR) repeat protein